MRQFNLCPPLRWIALSLILVTPCEALESIEGRWLGQSGPEDNRATLGLEITRTTDGNLEARLFIDLVGAYGEPLGTVQKISRNVYRVPAADMSLKLGKDDLSATGFLPDPNSSVFLKPVSLLPTLPAQPILPSGPEPRWKTRLGGSIFAPVAVHDGVAFVGNADGVFSAVAVATGTRIWSFAAGRAIFGEALVTANSIYFVCDNGYLYRLDRASGKEVWRYDLGDGRVPRVLPNPFVYDYDYQAPRPVLADGVLLVGSGSGTFHAVAADTGERVWRLDGDHAIRKTAAILGSRVIFGTEAGVVRAVDLRTGKGIWQFDAKSPVTTPAIVDGKVIVGARDSMLYALDPGDGHAIWSQYWWGSWVESTAVESHGLAYIGSGDLVRVSCIDPKSGRNLWRSDVGGWVLQRPLVTEATVYVGVSGARRAASFWPPQASALMALDRSTGRVLWRWSMPELTGAFLHGFVAAPVNAGESVLIGGVDGTLYAFAVDESTQPSRNSAQLVSRPRD
jgi:outer membrane protein assembly factor BamB